MSSQSRVDPSLAEQDLLVLAAQAGNQRAFTALFKLHHRSLLRFAAKFCSDPDLARDAVQFECNAADICTNGLAVVDHD